MTWRARAARALVIAALAMAATGCGDGGLGVPRPGGTDLPPCDPPAKIDRPTWFPPDLPLPSSAYAAEEIETQTSFRAAVFVVPGELGELDAFIRERWPAAGYELAQGEAEPGEFENSFTKPPAAGRIKANAVPCEPGYSTLLVQYLAEGPGVVPAT